MNNFDLEEFLETAKPRQDLVHTEIARVNEVYLVDGYLEVFLEEGPRLLFKHGFNLERDDTLRYHVFKGVKVEQKGFKGVMVKAIHESGIECLLKPYDALGSEVKDYVKEIKKSDEIIEQLEEKDSSNELIKFFGLDNSIKRFDITYFVMRELRSVEWPFKAEKLRGGVTFTYLNSTIIKDYQLESMIDHELPDLPQRYRAIPPIHYPNVPKRLIGD